MAKGDMKQVKDDNWTGAEIESCCRIARMLNVTPKEASKYIVPIAVTSAEKVNALEKWSKDRTIPAGEIVIKKVEKSLRDLG